MPGGKQLKLKEKKKLVETSRYIPTFARYIRNPYWGDSNVIIHARNKQFLKKLEVNAFLWGNGAQRFPVVQEYAAALFISAAY